MKAQVSFTRGKALLEARKYQEARELLAEATVLYPDHDEARALLAWSSISSVSSEGDHHVQDRAPSSADVGGSLRRDRMESTSSQSISPGDRCVPAGAGANSGVSRRLNGLGSALFELAQYDAAFRRSRTRSAGPGPSLALSPRRRGHSGPRWPGASTIWGATARPWRCFVRASLASPDSHQLHVGMGWCYIKLGQKGDARTAFQRALQLGPGDEAAREGLRRVSSR